jgi:hypothetical protein
MKVKQYKMRDAVAAQAKQIILPKFVIEVPQNDILDMGQGETQLLDRVNLLKNFKLSNKIRSPDLGCTEKNLLFSLFAVALTKGAFINKPSLGSSNLIALALAGIST